MSLWASIYDEALRAIELIFRVCVVHQHVPMRKEEGGVEGRPVNPPQQRLHMHPTSLAPILSFTIHFSPSVCYLQEHLSQYEMAHCPGLLSLWGCPDRNPTFIGQWPQQIS